MASKRFLVFQHVPWEGPGAFLLRSADRLGIELCVVEVWHESIPQFDSYDGLIVLGGTPNVDEEAAYPFLKEEKAAVRLALREDMPYMGFCLGHQLLADALGARIGPNLCRSVGFTRGLLTRAGMGHPLFYGLPNNFPVFKWHGQAVLTPVPKIIQILVTSTQCEVEAISVEGRPHVIGLQFDNHAACAEEVEKWLESDQAWLSQPPAVNGADVLKAAREQEFLLGVQFDVLFENYVKLVL